MRKFTTIVAALLLSVATFAQAPQGFSYQAVVRDAQNAIVANQQVDVTLTITAEVNGQAVQTYTEKHTVSTNQNGLLTLVVGQGESNQKLSDIKWNMPNAIYNMRTETKYGTANTQLLSVPFAMYAAQAGELDYQQLAKTLNSSDVQAILNFVKADELLNYAKKTDIPAEPDLSDYAKKSDIPTDYATTSYVADSINYIRSAYAKKADVSANYVTKEAFENYVLSGGDAESVDLTVYAKNADVEATYAKKTDIPAAPDLSGYAKKSDIPTDYATMGYVSDSLSYIRSAYAKKTDIPSLSGYATTKFVSDSLNLYRSVFAQKADVARDYVTKEEFDNYVMSGGDAEAVDFTVYAKTVDVEKTYAKKTDIPATPDLSGFVKRDTLSVYAYRSDLDDYATLRYVSDSLDHIRSAYALKSEIPTIPTIPTVPTKVSALENDANYLTEHQDISGKQDVITDLATIRIGAALGATALQEHQSLAAYTTTAKLNDTLAAYAKTADVEAAYATKTEVAGIQNAISDIETIRIGAALGATALQSHQSLANYVTTAKLNDTLAAYAKSADVEAAYATKAEVAAKQNAIDDIQTIRIGAALGATALQEHQSLAAYTTKAKLNDTLAEYAKTTKLNDTLGHYVTIAELNDKNYVTLGDVNGEIDLDGYYSKNEVDALIQTLQTAMAQLTKNANQIGDMPLANVTVKVVYANDYSGNTNIATVSFLGKNLKSGETTFKVPAYSPVFLSVALSTFNVSNTYYTYTVKINGQYFDNVACVYQVAEENVYNSGKVASFNYNTDFCKKSLSNIKIGSGEKDDTYNNRAIYQDPNYIYVDVVDAMQDIDINNGSPRSQSGYTNRKYFENRLLIGLTSACYNSSYADAYLVSKYSSGDASPRIGMKPRWYSWSDGWRYDNYDNNRDYEYAMGLLHMTNNNQSNTYINPIYAKVPNFIYKNNFTTKTLYKVGTESGTGLGRNGLNANMNNQVVGPFNQTNNTIVIEVSSYTVVN